MEKNKSLRIINKNITNNFSNEDNIIAFSEDMNSIPGTVDFENVMRDLTENGTTLTENNINTIYEGENTYYRDALVSSILN